MPCRRFFPFLLMLLAAVLIGGGCDQLLDTDDDEADTSGLVGAWIARSMTFTNASNTAESVDIIDAGASFTLDISDSGTFIVTQVWPESSPEVINGTWSADEDSLFIDEGEGALSMGYTLAGDVLTIQRTGEGFDFDDDGSDEAATLVIVLDRYTYQEGNYLAALAGVWTASEFLFTNPVNPSETFDLIEWGGVFVIKVDAGGTYALLNFWPDDEDPATIESGSISAGADTIAVVTTDGTMVLDYSVDIGNADHMTMDLAAPLYDFDDDGTDDTANLHIDLSRSAEPTLAELAGVWNRASIVINDLENPGYSLNLPLGLAEVVAVDAGGTFTHLQVTPYDSTETDTGVLSIFGGALIIDDDDPSSYANAVNMSFAGTSFGISMPEWIDHDSDGTDEPVRIDLGFVPYDGATMSDMAGSWSAYMYILDPQADLPSSDPISEGGTFTLELENDGSFEVITTYPGDESDLGTGTITMFGPIMEIQDDGSGERSYAFLNYFSSSSMDVINPYSYQDVNGDGFDELVQEDIRLESVTGIDVAALAGTWTGAIMEFSDPSGTWSSYDMIDSGGSFSLTVDGSGNFTVSITPPGETAENDSGTITVVGDMLKIYSNGDMSTSAVSYVLVDANTLQLISNDESHDFDGDGSDDPAVMYLALGK